MRTDGCAYGAVESDPIHPPLSASEREPPLVQRQRRILVGFTQWHLGPVYDLRSSPEASVQPGFLLHEPRRLERCAWYIA